VELTDRQRQIYGDPSIGRDDPVTGFDDYLATPEQIASWVAELAGCVLGLTGVFEPGRRNWSSSLPASALWILVRSSDPRETGPGTLAAKSPRTAEVAL
jgi:hypothetical protein